MVELQGIPVSPGVAIGPALVLRDGGVSVEPRLMDPDDAADQLTALRASVAEVAEELSRAREQTAALAGEETGDIFAAQLQMLRDPRLDGELVRRITRHRQSAAFAVDRVLGNYAAALRKLDSPLLAERSQDVLDIRRQLLTKLGAMDGDPLSDIDRESVVLAANLTPSETANLDRRFVRGFATEAGGPGGHTAIVAKGLELPAVVGIGPFLEEVAGGVTTIVDGDRGRFIIDPDAEQLAYYRGRIERRRSLAERLTEIRELPAETADGVRINLNANIEFPHEAEHGLQRGADGVGLYRTEFLYLTGDDEPTEEDHYEAYTEVARAMNGRPVVVRTLDLGADKVGPRSSGVAEANPFLGLRSIRLSLKHLDVFRPQLRAIMRAAVHGDLRVMFPLITTPGEYRQARMMWNVVAEDLAAAGVPHRSDIPVGMMVEVPAAVMMLEAFIGEVDFLSIGTNDLAQYTLAVDRSNPAVADLYQSADPAVLRLISRCIEVSGEANVPLGVCGEIASNPSRALLLVGMGIRSLSVPPVQLPRVKKAIRSVSACQCRQIAQRAMQLDGARDVDMYLRDRLETFVPELVVS